MCTSISMNKGGFCFGRNMDIEFHLGADVVLSPRRYAFHFKNGITGTLHHAILGMAVVRDGVPLYADAVNEYGLCMAGLSFPDCVYAKQAADGNTAIAPFELIPWVLGSCRTLTEARALLRTTSIVDIPFSASVPNTPLHWHIAHDELNESGALVVECTADGLQLHDDPVGIMTNSPPLPFHLTNLKQYVHLSAQYPAVSHNESAPFGRGFGAIGLPGDFSPTSRFVRAAFLLQNSPIEQDERRRTAQMLHILGNVAMPLGSVYTADGRAEYTAYSCCISGTKYLYRTYFDNTLHEVDIRSCDNDSNELRIFPCHDAF